MLSNLNYIIALPEPIRLLFCNKNNNLIIIKNKRKLFQKSLINVLVNNQKKLIYITDISSINLEYYSKKRLNKFRLTLLYNVKSFIINVNSSFFTKISLNGVGYRFVIKDKKKSIIQLILGFSHFIFIKLPKDFNIFLVKPTLLYITCENYIKLVKITQAIKHLKFPDAYKGKGVNLEYDKLSLKNGKKSQQ